MKIQELWGWASAVCLACCREELRQPGSWHLRAVRGGRVGPQTLGGLTSTPRAQHPMARPCHHTCPVTCARRRPALLGGQPWACEVRTWCRNTTVWSCVQTNSGFSPLASGVILQCSGFIFFSKSLRKQVHLAAAQLTGSHAHLRFSLGPCGSL